MEKKTILKHIGSILFFVTITFIFFLPQYQGKELVQGDQVKWHGMAEEAKKYHEETGNNVAWCGSMFSGMPGYTANVKHNYPNALNYIEKPFYLFDYHTGGIILFSLVCGYIFCLVFGCSIPIALLGAVAFAFSSYFPIIIEAGHMTKAWVIATMPLVIASLILIMKRKWIAGGLLFAYSLTDNIRHAHIQITYYLLILCLFIYVGYLISKIKEKKFEELAKSTGVMILGVSIAVVLNSASLYGNYEMGKTSIRGKSDLTTKVDGKQDKSSGLDMNYAFAWSYGKMETLTMLIPNIYGGASGGELSKDSNLAKAYKKNNIQVPNHLQTYTYWGEQPFTSGPVYFGAIICFLFVLSLLIVDRKYKWWVVAATAFLILLSWGNNLMGINEFLFHHLPFYNKFRTPSMALVGPQLTFVWFACLALKDIYEGKTNYDKLKKSLLIAGGITSTICLLFALVPTLFLTFSSSADAQLTNLPDWYKSALIADREDLTTSDAWRSFFLIAFTFCILYFTSLSKNKSYIGFGIIAIAIVSFFDLWSIDRRYLNENNFVKKSKRVEIPLTASNKYILEDKDPSYRVLTLNNPFNDSNVSYYHKSIGGYNAAKLRRYQDLIDIYIEPEIRLITNNLSNAKITTIREADNVLTNTATPVLDMLNMRYLIINSEMPAATNHSANGNAWFVKKVQYVDNADEEMQTLGDINPKETAVVDKSFSNIISEGEYNLDSTATITMTSYEPIRVKYESNSTTDNVAIFSEVFYQPRWKAYIDGKLVDHFRTNWILRGLKIPAGKHEIVFNDEPDTYWNLCRLVSLGSFILIFTILAVIGWWLKKQKFA